MGFLWPDSPVGLALQVWGMVVARARTGQVPGKEPSSSRHGGAPALSRAWGRVGPWRLLGGGEEGVCPVAPSLRIPSPEGPLPLLPLQAPLSATSPLPSLPHGPYRPSDFGAAPVAVEPLCVAHSHPGAASFLPGPAGLAGALGPASRPEWPCIRPGVLAKPGSSASPLSPAVCPSEPRHKSVTAVMAARGPCTLTLTQGPRHCGQQDRAGGVGRGLCWV